jgi:hypothetical protein
MSRIFLISSNTAVDPYPVYPLGMALMASALQSGGHHVCQYDCLAGDQPEVRLKKSLLEYDPDFVGISLRNIDNVDSLTSDNHWYLEEVKRLIEKIRQLTDAPISITSAPITVLSAKGSVLSVIFLNPLPMGTFHPESLTAKAP